MLKLHLRNWRCFDEIDVDVSKVTILLGKNSTGKSTIAYTLYMLKKLSLRGAESFDVIAQQLFGASYRSLVRYDGNKACLPSAVKLLADGSEAAKI